MKRALRYVLAALMIGAGVMHFARPAPFVAIVPDWLPAPLALVYISGVFEIAGGLGLLLARTRKAAAWGLVALFIAVFPANVHMALHEIQPVPGTSVPVWAMWARLPLQALLIAAAYWLTRDDAQS